MRISCVYAHILRKKQEWGGGAEAWGSAPAPALIRRAAQAALRGVLDPQECLRNALPRARACVPQGTPPDPLDRLVKTILFLKKRSHCGTFFVYISEIEKSNDEENYNFITAVFCKFSFCTGN